MSSIAYTTLDHGDLVFAGSDYPTTLLVDSVFETISVKRVTLSRNPFRNRWRLFQAQQALQQSNPECAVYCCKLDKATAFLCISDLAFSSVAADGVQDYLASKPTLNVMCAQLMSIGAALPESHQQCLMVLNSAVGIRHVYFIGGKPAFVRLLAPSGEDDIEPLEATQQHLQNRGMLVGNALVVCHGLSSSAQQAISQQWEAINLLDCLQSTNTSVAKASVAEVAVEAYVAKQRSRYLRGQLPAYWVAGLSLYRYRSRSMRTTATLFVLGLLVVVGLALFNINDWRAWLQTVATHKVVLSHTTELQSQAMTFSSAPALTAQRLHRLDVLTSMQAQGADALLLTVASIVDSHPLVSLNHISWFVVSVDELSEKITQFTHRERLAIESNHADNLLVLLSGNIDAETLSEQQALYSSFKNSLTAAPGVSEVIEEQTPVTQWRMPNSEPTGIAVDSFTLRFSLSHVAS